MKPKLYITSLLVIGIIIVVNLLAHEFHVRLDLTEDHQYTLSKATRNILNKLEEPVTVKAYFSENMPPQYARMRQDFQDMLIEYSNIADGQVLYEFINPNLSEVAEQEAVQLGVYPNVLSVREKDQMKQQKVYMGAVVSISEKKEVIPVINPGAAMEFALSTAIKKLSVINKPVIGFIQGHGEPSPDFMMQAGEQLNVLYTSKAVPMTDSTEIPGEIKTLVLISPKDSIPASHLEQLDTFLSRGGGLFIAINRVSGDPQRLYGVSVTTGLETWLKQKGITVQNSFLIDAKCATIGVPQRFGQFTIQANVPFCFIPVISTFSKHPITSGLEAVLLQIASPIQFKGDTSLHFTPLAYTSGLSGTLPAPQHFDINKKWKEEDFPLKNLVVAGALEGPLGGKGKTTKMVVIGDGDFPINGPPQEARRIGPDNVNLLVNSIDWLSDDTGLIELRTKGITARPVRELGATIKNIIRYANFLLPVLLVIVYGILRAQKNRLKRTKRMNENYEAK